MADAVQSTGDLVVRVLRGMMTFKLTAEQTGGAYTLVETVVEPGDGVPPHIQHKDEEAFYVVEGTMSFQLGDETVEHGPGGTVFIPTGVPHAFFNASDAPARMLIINSPGGIHEGFFKEVGTVVTDPANLPEVDMEAQIAKVMEAAPKYGIELLPPQE